ncbi:MAG: hypothetical protein ABII23_07730 [bacterium]
MKVMQDPATFKGGGLIRSISHGQGAFINGKIPDHITYDERILGESDFVDNIYSQINEADEDINKEKYTFEEVIDMIADKNGLDKTVICSKNRAYQVEKARKLAVYIGVRKLGLTNSAAGQTIKMTPSGITMLMKREKQFFEKIRKKSIKELVGI